MPAFSIVKKYKKLLALGKISLLDFFKILRENRKKKKENQVREAINGKSPLSTCHVTVSKATTYFTSILSSDSESPLRTTTEDTPPTWTIEKVDTALKQCSNSSSPGLDGVTFQSLKPKSRDPKDIATALNPLVSIFKRPVSRWPSG